MNILGLSYMYHDSAAVLCKDGDIVAAAAEERFLRRKHTVEFPKRAIQYCLSEGEITMDDIDCVAFYEKPYLKFERILKTHLIAYPFSYRSFKEFLPLWLSYKLHVPQIIREETGCKGKILFCDHHYAHAASAFLPSPFDKAVILTVDGTGEWSTLSYGIGEGQRIRLIKDIKFPHSLGLLYSAVTAHLGFKVNWAEGTVMGLAAYGKPAFCKEFEKLIDVKGDGSFKLDMNYFSFHSDIVMTNKKFAQLLCPPRTPAEKIEQVHRDVAATLQYTLESTMLKIASHLYSLHKIDSLCIAGGVGLNCTVNGKIIKETPFRNIFVQPAAGDDGGALGAALYIYTRLFGGKKRWMMDSASLGPAYSNEYIQSFLQSRNMSYIFLSDDELVRYVAEHVFNNKIIGWFQGRMEFGPRALGNRSILANPCNPGIKQLLNERVKHREPFRPYAPSVCIEDAGDYFDVAYPSPFMTISASVREEKKSVIPGVVHEDGTARVQTVSEKDQKLYWGLLRAFQGISGVPVLVNTSFNGNGEPIVCTPADAVGCFLDTDMDMLVLGNFVLETKERISHEFF